MPEEDDGNRLLFWQGNSVEIAYMSDGRALTMRTIRHLSVENIIDVTTADRLLVIVSLDQPMKNYTRSYSARVFDIATAHLQTTLTSPDGHLLGAAISPDGRRVAFSLCVPGPECRLDVQDINGNNRRNVTGGAKYHSPVSWSPDGTKVTYSAESGRVAMVGVSSAAFRLLAQGTEPDWSPDGRYIVYQNTRQIRMLDLTYMTDRPIYEQIEGENDLIAAMPRWSRDGRFVSFNVPAGSLAQWLTCKVYSVDGESVETVRRKSGKFCGPWFTAHE